jgi:hypothetical protein
MANDLTTLEVKAAFQTEYDSKPTTGTKAAFTKRLRAMEVPAELMPSPAKKATTSSADDLVIAALLARLKG